jgi:hypothetical protein
MFRCNAGPPCCTAEEKPAIYATPYLTNLCLKAGAQLMAKIGNLVAPSVASTVAA